MNKREQRAAIIADTLSGNPNVSIKELAKILNVSEITVRRDITYLKEIGVMRTRNLFSFTANEQPSNKFSNAADNTAIIPNFEEKARIAKAAADLIEENDTIIIDAGSTSGMISNYIPIGLNNTVISYNSEFIPILCQRTDINLIFIGGFFHQASRIFESDESLHLMQRICAKKMFVNAAGVHRQFGLTSSFSHEVAVKKTAINSSLTKILVADSAKFGKVFISNFASLEDIDTIISDEKLSSEWQKIIVNEYGIKLHLV